MQGPDQMAAEECGEAKTQSTGEKRERAEALVDE